jgi:energy-converting hydrogenase Eha subunit C
VQSLFGWLETTWFAEGVGQSIGLTAGLSAAHAIGFTLVMSAGVASSLRAAGLVLRRRPLEEFLRPAIRLLAIGLIVSITTGFLLFSPRASYTAPSHVFQLKIALILTAAIYEFALGYKVLRGTGLGEGAQRVAGVVGLALWLSLAGAACWFVLFE